MLFNLASALSVISAASAAVITVKVGDGGFVYNPASITAQNGDIVNFRFTSSPGNHTVSQAAFAKPCEQLDGGFDSGYVFVPANFTGPPAEWNLTISDASKPIWFYCKQPNPSLHCISGMVGAINPPSSGSTLEGFTNAAKALGSPPAQSPGAMTGVGAAATAAPSPLAPTSASPSSTAPASGSSSATTGSPSGKATSLASNGLWALLAAVMGIAIA